MKKLFYGDTELSKKKKKYSFDYVRTIIGLHDQVIIVTAWQGSFYLFTVFTRYWTFKLLQFMPIFIEVSLKREQTGERNPIPKKIIKSTF